MARDAKSRFSDRVEAYVRSRPGYPAAVVDVLRETVGLQAGQTLADLGAGTGILSRVFVDAGIRVIGVEPNAPMREAAVELLADAAGFRAVDGSAEATGLPDGSVVGVVAGQAFHWFEVDAAAIEARRVVRPRGFAAILWNNRRLEGTPFLVAYEDFVRRWGTDYVRVAATYADPDALRRYFGATPIRQTLDNRQTLDREGMVGRLLSSSYIPAVDHPDHPAMLAAAHAMFDAHHEDGHVTLEYDCDVHSARLV